MRITGADIASRTRGRIVSGDPARSPSGCSIDSRSVRPGELFFAIVGTVHDGHRFVAEAMAAGASGVVVSDESSANELPPGSLVILVADTTRALQDLAAARRRQGGLVVAAITGSVGKTTTKELARLLVSGDRPTHASPGNLNNHYGLPLAILSVPPDAEAVVLELGISTPGEMDRLVEIAEPDLGLVTLISAVHVGNFASFADLCEEKMKLPRGSGSAILNADDPEQVGRASGVTAPVTFFGSEARRGGDVRLVEIRAAGLFGSTIVVEESGTRREVACPLPGAHNARNLVAASALARAMGVRWEIIARQAPLAQAQKHRGEIIRVAGATVVDDCYNANPRAMRAAIDLLSTIEVRGRRILVAGDMLELGDIAAAEHARLGAEAASKIDILLGVGGLSLHAVEAARAGGAAADHVADAEAAGLWLERTLRDGDVVLVKGSRGIHLDVAIDHLLATRGATASNGKASS